MKHPPPDPATFVPQLRLVRGSLGAAILAANPGASEATLNRAVDHLINVVLFTRVLEDRGLIPPRSGQGYGVLSALVRETREGARCNGRRGD